MRDERSMFGVPRPPAGVVFCCRACSGMGRQPKVALFCARYGPAEASDLTVSIEDASSQEGVRSSFRVVRSEERAVPLQVPGN